MRLHKKKKEEEKRVAIMDTKGTLKVPALDKSISTEYEFLNWARKFK